MEESPLESDVIAFVSSETGTRMKRLSLATTLVKDLGMDGDDGVEFIIAFAERYGLDADRFPFVRHFHPEYLCGAGSLLPGLWLWLTGNLPEVMPITLQDLVKAAARKEWSTPRGL
jgi:hypothetical protein